MELLVHQSLLTWDTSITSHDFIHYSSVLDPELFISNYLNVRPKTLKQLEENILTLEFSRLITDSNFLDYIPKE